MTQKLFFELIQVALGQKEKLSHHPSEKEWFELFEISQKQALVGVAMVALDKLSYQGQKPPKEMIYEWIGKSECIRQNNKRLDRCCEQLQKRLLEKGLQSSILKGQGIAGYYDEKLKELRQSGDIDVFVKCGREDALKWAKSEDIKIKDWDYKHAHLDIWNDVAVEMHYRVEVMLNLWKNRRLQKWFDAHTEDIFGYTEYTGKGTITMPSVEFNVFYILLHIYRHFLYEGVGLRQIMDYYFVLKRLSVECLASKNNPELAESTEAISSFGMMRFAKGLMWVMQEVQAMPREWMIFDADEKEGRYILKQVMEGGNFGHYDQRLQKGRGKWNTVKKVCKHNQHLLTHYPSDVVWAPIWFVWHKCWKLTHWHGDT